MDPGREDVTVLLAELTKGNKTAGIKAYSLSVLGDAPTGGRIHAAGTKRPYASGHSPGTRGLSEAGRTTLS